MYLTAQHVRAPDGRSGINGYRYEHGPLEWSVPPLSIPEEEPGVLVHWHTAVEPPGNRVRSYLDIIAPDSAPIAEIHRSLLTFLSQVEGTALPWEGIVGRCRFRVGLDQGLADTWRAEIAALYRRACEVRACPETSQHPAA